MRALVMCLALAGCGAAAPAGPPPQAHPVPIYAANVSEWQAAEPGERNAGAREWAHVVFPNARDDQLDDLADKLVICIDDAVLRAQPTSPISPLASACEDYVTP